MERSWWWKAALYGFVTVVAVLYLIPTVVPEDKQPAFIQKHFQKRIQLGLDLQGGLHLVYEVNVDKAVAGKVDRLASDLEDRLHKDKGVADLNVNREGRDDIILTFKPPAEQAKLDDAILKDYRKALDIVSRDPATGVVRLRLDPDQVEEVRDYALRQGIETIRGRVDKFGVAEPTIIKKGTDIIVELPGLKSADFERIKSIIGRTAQLEFKIVDDGSEYMRKVAASVPKGQGIDVVPESWTEKDIEQAARGRLPALEEPRRPAEVLRRPDRRPGPAAGSRDRVRGDPGAQRERRSDAGPLLAHVLPAQAGGADRRVPVERRPDLGPADRAARGLVRVRPPGRRDLRADDRRQHRPQDGHPPRRQDQQRPGHRGAHRGARPHHAGRLRRSVRAAARGQGPGRRAAFGRAAGAAAQDLRDAGRPDDGARRGPEGQVLDVHRRGRGRAVHGHLLPAVRESSRSSP